MFDESPRHDLKLLLGDPNAQVTSDRSFLPGVIGGHSHHSSSNDNGTRLQDFCVAHHLSIGGTLFQDKDIQDKDIQGYVEITQRSNCKSDRSHLYQHAFWRLSMLKVKVYKGADIGSDHYLARA